MHFILASSSPRRKKLLKQIGIKFRVIPSNASENIDPNKSISSNAQQIALRKAMQVAEHIKKGIVIGADTIVVIDHHILGKPKDKNDAKRMLRLLSGREHTVYTGLALVDAITKCYLTACEATKVTFRDLDEDEIIRYIASGSPLDKAGAYGIQDDYGAVFITRINGCFYNVVGFPLARFYQMCKELKLILRKKKFKRGRTKRNPL